MRYPFIPVMLILVVCSLGIYIGCGDDDDDDEGSKDTYKCFCNCQTPIGDVLNGFEVCAESENDAYSKADDHMDNSTCGYYWTCHSCEKESDGC